MAHERFVSTNRAVLLSVGVVNFVFGVALALFINHYIRDFSILITPEWYDSYWLPLWVACVCYAAEALWVQLPADWLYGVMITGPPYGWHAGVVTAMYLKGGSGSSMSEYLKLAIPAVLLALSGTVLNPVVARLVAQLKPKRKMNPTG